MLAAARPHARLFTARHRRAGVHAVARRRGRRSSPRRPGRTAARPAAAPWLPGDGPPARRAARPSGAAVRARRHSCALLPSHRYHTVAWSIFSETHLCGRAHAQNHFQMFTRVRSSHGLVRRKTHHACWLWSRHLCWSDGRRTSCRHQTRASCGRPDERLHLG